MKHLTHGGCIHTSREELLTTGGKHNLHSSGNFTAGHSGSIISVLLDPIKALSVGQRGRDTNHYHMQLALKGWAVGSHGRSLSTGV